MERIIGLIDMDCFYAQVEQRERPELWGKPVIVVQHTRKGVQGGILAVSYEAREFGIKRGMSVADAKIKCADLNVCHVPIGEHVDKADIQKYRDASAEVFEVLNTYDSTIVVEKASVDEAFLDLSVYVENNLQSQNNRTFDEVLAELRTSLPTTHAADGKDVVKDGQYPYDRSISLENWLQKCRFDASQLRLALAAQVVEDIRAKIRERTEFFCSAGIANNKMMAKLVCARHKPRQQTVVAAEHLATILKDTPISSVRGFGGKMGNQMKEQFGITKMGELLFVEDSLLRSVFPNHAEWLRKVAVGFDDEPIRPRNEASSIAVSKNLPGKTAIRTMRDFNYWLDGLTRELCKRLMTDQLQNKRVAENVVFALATDEGRPQKTLKIATYNPDVLIDMLRKAMRPFNKSTDENIWDPPVYYMHLGANRFSQGMSAQSRMITEWVKKSEEDKTQLENAKKEEELDIVEVAGPSRENIPDTDNKIVKKANECYSAQGPARSNLSVQPENEEFIEVDGEKISRKVFAELPDFIRKEYEHRMALENARKLKTLKEKPKEAKKEEKRGRKRPTKDTNQQPKPKRIDSFFKK